jgi:DNA-binding NtrC family response regulator
MIAFPGTGLKAGCAPTGPKRTIRPLRIVEREAIKDAIAARSGNIPIAAALLDISPSTIYRKRQGWEADADAADGSGRVEAGGTPA